eukprot:CAMPEP_0169119380 /NCGR_PEP_ID=MMETSP1015-20121227/31525_1 /TAXON_ID=342587 /ORGANISM="Karlodinium micrum, Strain CCMP2283" /LENGTH=196 /DNA_ID=CAMNT_0009182255 /DNA_START=90 /DNA_END=680 /DNA_ORIENTATION=-
MCTAKNTFLHFFYEGRHSQPRSRSAPSRRQLPKAPEVPLYVAPSFDSSDVQSSEFPCSRNYERWEEWMDNENIYTVMIRNIPCSCKRHDVDEAVRKLGLNTHDFFYCPTRSGRTRGYAFVNFPDPTLTRQFVKEMTGYRFKGKESTKVITVVPAHLQGYGENFMYFESKFVTRHRDARPLFRKRAEGDSSEALILD